MLVVHRVISFWFWFLCFWDMSFLCLSLMRSSVVQIFSFSRTVCGWLRNLDEFIVVPIINSTWLAIVAEADLRCADFLSEESCHKLVVYTSFWSWLLNASSVLTSLKCAALLFWFSNAFWVCWLFMGVLGFGFWCLCFWNMSFFLSSSLMRFFVVQIFSFSRTMWLVKKCWWVHCCSNHQIYWLSDRCRSGFALWWSLSEGSFRHKLVVSTSFWSWLLNVSSVLTSLKCTYWHLQYWHLWNTHTATFF